MLDSPITLLLLGISAASAIASYTAHRRRSRQALPDLSTLSEAELLAALAALETQGNDARSTAQTHASQVATHSISAMHAASRIREAGHPKSVSLIEQDHDVRRRITFLIVEEIERRQVRTQR